MSMDTYSCMDKQARCSECGQFMPWSRSKQVERSDGMPLPSPVLVEVGVCVHCAVELERAEEAFNAREGARD